MTKAEFIMFAAEISATYKYNTASGRVDKLNQDFSVLWDKLSSENFAPVPPRPFAAGDLVFCAEYGHGVVANSERWQSEDYPIYVRFTAGDEATYTKDGREFLGKDGVLFHAVRNEIKK